MGSAQSLCVTFFMILCFSNQSSPDSKWHWTKFVKSWCHLGINMQFCLVRCDGFQFFGKQFPCCLLMVSSWLEPLTVAIVFLYSWMYLSQLCPRRLHNQSKFCFLATIAYTNIELSHNCHLLICVCLENRVRCIEVNIREECVLCSQYNRQCSCVQFHLYLLAIYSM